jgi:hypothetical protein
MLQKSSKAYGCSELVRKVLDFFYIDGMYVLSKERFEAETLLKEKKEVVKQQFPIKWINLGGKEGNAEEWRWHRFGY